MTKLPYTFSSDAAAHDAACEKIANLTPKDKKLDLSDFGLATLPPAIYEKKWITKLILTNNKISTLPDELHDLHHLTEINIRNNKLTQFPPVIYSMRKLKIIDLRSNNIERIEASIRQLTNIMRLDISSNLLRDLPKELGSITVLYLAAENDKWPLKKGLWLDGNPLQEPFLTFVSMGQPLATLNTIKYLNDEMTDYELRNILNFGKIDKSTQDISLPPAGNWQFTRTRKVGELINSLSKAVIELKHVIESSNHLGELDSIISDIEREQIIALLSAFIESLKAPYMDTKHTHDMRSWLKSFGKKVSDRTIDTTLKIGIDRVIIGIDKILHMF